MNKLQNGIYGALMGLGAYLLTVLLLTIVLAMPMRGEFVSLFFMLLTFGFIIGIIFVMVGVIVAVNKSPLRAVRPLIITSVIVLCAVGGCFGLLGVY